ncbi:outer membrane beta-barrel protein [Yoonia sp. BS5-3]|uniref:Outer membrane protein n=1 Tax=Yoonia phaeophyticola TaxID=3137369 RepID=A0ABZ2V6H7_9RHOB
MKPIAAVIIAALPSATLADFSGAYGGAALGVVSPNLDFSDLLEGLIDEDIVIGLEDTTSLSAFAGYQIQNGAFVYGGEVAFTTAPNMEFVGVSIDNSATDIKGRLGYAVDDQLLAYGALGYSQVTIDIDDIDLELDADGLFLGAGVDYLLTDNIVLGAEVSTRKVSIDLDEFDIDQDVDLDTNTFALRASYKF